MDPGSISVDSWVPDSEGGGSLTFEFLHGDSDDNVLFFSVSSEPIIFDIIGLEFDTTVLSASVVSDPDGIVWGGIVMNSVVAGMVVDFDTASTAIFKVQTASTPTSLNVWRGYRDPELVASARFRTDLRTDLGDTVATPEPTAALVFAAGLVVVGSATRRRAKA